MSEDLSTRRKRLRYQCWYRGTKELDQLLGQFADVHLDRFNEDQVDKFEAILEEPEQLIYRWITGQEGVPEAHNNDVMQLIKDFKFSA